jgi:hypothetical protein
MQLSVRPLVAAVLSGIAMHANAELYTTSIGGPLPEYFQNDDFVFPPVDLGFAFDLFGNTYTSVFVNNNGNVTFGAPTGNYSPYLQLTPPMIAPFLTDLDTRGGGDSAGVFLTQTAHQFVVTWQDMGYWYQNYSGRATFQLVLNDPNAPIAAGEGKIGFFYGAMSAGTDAYDALAGFRDGQPDVNPGEFRFSYRTGSTTEVTASLNNTHVWFDVVDGAPVAVSAVPEPETYALMLAGLGAVAFGARRKAKAKA